MIKEINCIKMDSNIETTALELIRTILGEHVPTDVLLQCLHQANFEVTTAINLYFASLTVQVDVTCSLRSGLAITLHQSEGVGMVGKINAYATLTTGNVIYDTITEANEKYRVLRIRKRSGSSGSYFRNGDIVSIECHGLWLKVATLSKYLQWRPANRSDRNKFIMEGLPHGAWLTMDRTFTLRSVKYPSRQITIMEDKPPGISAFNDRLHRCFLMASKEAREPVHFQGSFTASAYDTIPRPGDPVHADTSVGLTDDTAALRSVNEKRHSITAAMSQSDSALDQMIAILGKKEDRDILARFLDGAGGNIEVALEHYFMAGTTGDLVIPTSSLHSTTHELLLPMPQHTPTHSHSSSLGMVLEEKVGDSDSDASASSEDITPMSSPIPLPALSPDSGNTGDSRARLNLEDFEMKSVLGRGSFGAVVMVRYKQDGRIFALKILKKTTMKKADRSNAEAERQILQRINHPYISSLVFAFQTPERLYLGMKYFAGGDLFYHLNERGKLQTHVARLYAAEMVLAISYLHDINILYRDLKPSNVMIDRDGHIGIVDFGLSKQGISGKSHGVKTLSGTAEYVAPEALVQYSDGSRDYGKSYDWWSLGIVLYEMLVGQSPFFDDNERKMLENIVNATVLFPQDFDDDARDIILKFLDRNPSSRLGADPDGNIQSIQRHPFFASIHWGKLQNREVEAYWKPKLSSETDTRYVDPEFKSEGPPSASGDHSGGAAVKGNRFSQFSFDFQGPHAPSPVERR